jgi:hypothetical protein
MSKLNEKAKKYFAEQGKKNDDKIEHGFNKEYIDSEEETRLKLVYLAIEFILTAIGYFLIGYHTNGWVVIGLFLVFWGNNLSITRSLVSNTKNRMKDIWKNDK